MLAMVYTHKRMYLHVRFYVFAQYPCLGNRGLLQEDDELADLREADTYVAGFLDREIENRQDLHDVFVNGTCKCVFA